MKLLNNFLLTLICAATISSCNAMTPEQQARVNDQLIKATLRGDLPGVKLAVAAGANVHCNDNSALHISTQWGHLHIVRYLVEHGVNIHVQDDYVLRSTAAIGHLHIVQYLVEHGANIHADNDKPVRSAANNKQWRIVTYLLQCGADRSALDEYQLNLLNKYVLSELESALRHDNWHRVEELLSVVHVHELPQDIQQQIRAILVPAGQKMFISTCLVLRTSTQIRNTNLASRTLSFIVGPNTRAAFSHLREIDTHEITQ